MTGPRYSIVPNDAVDDPRIKEAHLRVLLILGSHSDRNGWCEVNQANVAQRARCARETVNRTVKDLRSWGYVRVKSQKGPSGRNVNKYQVVMDREERSVSDAHVTRDVDVTCDVDVTTAVTSKDHNGCDVQTSQLNDPSLTIPPKPPDLEAEFLAVVKAWPRVAQGHEEQAWEIFRKLTGEEQAQAITVARRYPSECRAAAARIQRPFDQHVRFTKTLPKWLGEKKWLGSEASAALASPEAKRIAAGLDQQVFNRGEKANPKLFAKCLTIMGPKWAWKADWGEAIFPAEVVNEARLALRNEMIGSDL